ncbi:MAG: hypothetical protein HC771_08730 [Synechococcales cyanobacterium CRU_2_2]|nr:hypothetical protein [Synechococcales cyanobacterium CRU_2_2]
MKTLWFFARQLVKPRQLLANGDVLSWMRSPLLRPRSLLLCLVAVAVMTGLTGQKFYNQPRLNVGTLAQQTLQAPEDVTVPNPQRTEQLRKAARTAAIPVLSMSPTVNQEIRENLERNLAHGAALRSRLGRFPPPPPPTSSPPPFSSLSDSFPSRSGWLYAKRCASPSRRHRITSYWP